MLKKIKHIMNIVISSTFGVYLGKVLFVWFDYKNNPGLYKLYSAPWYTEIIVASVAYGIILFAAIAIQCFVIYKIKQSKD